MKNLFIYPKNSFFLPFWCFIFSNIFVSNIFFGKKIFAQENSQNVSKNLLEKVSFQLKVLDKKQKVVGFASVGLVQAGNVIFAGITDENGEIKGENIAFGTYTLKISHVDFKDFMQENIIFSKENIPENGVLLLENVILQDNETMEAVEIVAKKPILERLPDKVVMNVENSMFSTGTNAETLFQGLPAVSLTQEGQISLKGREGVTVMMDDKPIYVAGRDLKNFLRSLPSSQIASIEVISNPSAKYDAQGTAGIINIKLKKGAKLEGWQANINASAGQGVYEKLNAGADVNVANKKMNVFASYSYDYPYRFEKMEAKRGFENQNNPTFFNQTGHFPMLYKTHNHKTNIDVYLHPNHTLSAGFYGSITNGFYKGGTNTEILNAQNLRDSTLYTDQNYDEKWGDYTANITYKYVINDKGTELTASGDFFNYYQDTRQVFTTDYTNNQGIRLNFSDISRGKIPINLRVLTTKADFTHSFTKMLKFEAGFKAIYMRTASDVAFFTNDVLDKNRTNDFVYDENIHAGYINLQSRWNTWRFQAGIRTEYTQGQGEQRTIGRNFTRNYLNFFPSFAIGKEFDKKNQINITYSRRIERPSYQELNPFQYYLDPYTAWAGNPLLLPQFSHNFELSHTYNDFLTTEIGYNTTENVLTYSILQDDITRTTLYTQQNLARLDQFTFSTTLQFEFFKWWSGQLYGGAYYKQLFNQSVTPNTTQSQWTYQINTTQMFRFGKNWGGEMQFFYNSPELDGVAITLSNYGLSVGVEKKLLKEKMTLKANLTDVFYTNRYGNDAQSANLDNSMLWKWDSRVFTLSFSYRLGGGFLGNKTTEKEETGNEKIKGRK